MHTLDSWVIIFDKLVSHITDSESGLANTSGFVVDRFQSLSVTLGTGKGRLTTEDNGVEFTHPRIQDRGRRNKSAAYGNQTEERGLGGKRKAMRS
jgi:hypothetical protein